MEKLNSQEKDFYLVETMNKLKGVHKVEKISRKKLNYNSQFVNPVIGFNLGDPEVLGDIAQILKTQITATKSSNQNELKQYMTIVENFVVNYFNIDQTGPSPSKTRKSKAKREQGQNFDDLNLETTEDLDKEAAKIEKIIRKNSKFRFSEKL